VLVLPVAGNKSTTAAKPEKPDSARLSVGEPKVQRGLPNTLWEPRHRIFSANSLAVLSALCDKGLAVLGDLGVLGGERLS